MRHLLFAAAALIAGLLPLASNADAAARIPAPATTAIQLTGGIGHAALPRPTRTGEAQVAQIAPPQND